MDKKLPLLNEKEIDCCGCGVCEFICPCKAIKMEYNKEGFLYPIINENLCVCCYKCMEYCSFKKLVLK